MNEMIRPPFTVLILKDSRHPATIRVTYGLILAVLGGFSLAGVFMGFALSYFVFNGPGDLSPAVVEQPAGVYSFTEKREAGASRGGPEMYDFSMRRNADDDAVVDLHFTSPPIREGIYVWLIVNPDAETAGEMVVYPRNPLFRGLPVDYRNGVFFPPTGEDHLEIRMAGEIEGIELESVRILLYSHAGELLSDRRFQFVQTTG